MKITKTMLNEVKLMSASALCHQNSAITLPLKTSLTLHIKAIFTANERQPWTDSHDYYFEYLIIHFDYLIIQFDYLIIG